jgi:hypothetical protein
MAVSGQHHALAGIFMHDEQSAPILYGGDWTGLKNFYGRWRAENSNRPYRDLNPDCSAHRQLLYWNIRVISTNVGKWNREYFAISRITTYTNTHMYTYATYYELLIASLNNLHIYVYVTTETRNPLVRIIAKGTRSP